MSDRDPTYLFRPIYSYSEADRLARVSRGTSRRWIEGYSYVGREGERVAQPPVTPDRPVAGDGVSFTDLIEVAAIGQFKQLGFSLRRIRTIVEAAQQEFGVTHPLSMLEFKTDGRDVFVKHDTLLHDVLRNQAQLAWDEILSPFLETLDYRDAIAYRWWPLGKSRPVMIDPEYGFGQPVVADSGIRTETLRERIEAGDSYDQIAHDFNVRRGDIESAVQYELLQAA